MTTVAIVGICLLNEATDQYVCRSPYDVFRAQLARLDYEAILQRVQRHVATHFGFNVPHTTSAHLWQQRVITEALVHERLIDTALLLFKVRFTHTRRSIAHSFCNCFRLSVVFLIVSYVYFVCSYFAIVYFLLENPSLNLAAKHFLGLKQNLSLSAGSD